MSSSLYWSTHRALEASQGLASSHRCRCGARAKDWAYQHTAADELTEDGLAFSLNPDDYRPMCRPCHAALDQTGAKIAPKTSATLRARFENDLVFREIKKGVACNMTVARVQRTEVDSEFKERLRDASIRGATTGAKARRRCLGCEMTSHPVGIGKHQKASGRLGWVTVP